MAEMQTTLFIAAGDYLNGDDAVSHRVLALLGAPTGVSMFDVVQWSGELAPKIARAQEVVFVDAEQQLGEPWLEPVDGRTTTGRIVDRARRDFQFRGRAYHCHVPGLEFGRRSIGLTAYAESRARQAAGILRRFLGATV
jgi:hypothetical protein